MPQHYGDDMLVHLQRMFMQEPQEPPQDTTEVVQGGEEEGGLLSGLLGLVKGLFTPSPEKQRLQSIVDQPLMQDTVFQLVGGEPEGGIGLRNNPFVMLLDALLRDFDIAATANPRGMDIEFSKAALAPDREQDEIESIMFHELAHIADFRGEEAPLADMREAVRERYPDARNRDFVDYASVNEEEHFGEAFRGGLNFIREWNRLLAKEPEAAKKVNVWNLLDREDEFLPGTREVVLGLLQHPLYRTSLVALALAGPEKVDRDLLNRDNEE